MNVIQIFLKTSGSIAELYKDFNLYKGLYRNTQIFVYVPKSILYNEDGFTNSVKTGAILTTPNGSQITTQSYFTLYLQDETVNGIEYSVYTQVMPKIFAQYAGTQTIVVNVSSTDSNESTPQIVAITTSQTAQLIVMNSAYLDQDESIDPSQTEIIQGQINELGERIDANKTQIEANAADIAEINEKLPDIEQAAAAAADAVEAAKQAAASAEAAQSDAAAAAASANASAASASQANNSAIAANNSAIAAANSASQSEQYAQTSGNYAASSSLSAFNAASNASAALSSANQSAQSAEDSAESANEAEDHAKNAATSASSSAESASQSAQSALESYGYMEQAKDYAQKEYQIYDSFADLPRPGDPAFIYLVPKVQSREYVQSMVQTLSSSGVDISNATEKELYALALVQPVAESDNDNYSEYIWVTNIQDYEFIGSINDIDLTDYAKIDGTYPNMTVGKAGQLSTPRGLQVDLESEQAGQFDGSQDVNIGVSGVLPVSHGGTGATDLSDVTVGTATNTPKSLYNLGAYDTYVDNGDGTVTVTRKTGRYDVPINNFIVSGDHFAQSISLPNGSSLGYATDTGYNANATSNVYKLGFYGVDKSFYVSVDNWLRIWDSSYSKDATGLAQFKAALEAAGGMYILYETTTSLTSFTEKLPANVPINTLDQHMSDIVREEVEKTLNLADMIISAKSYNQGQPGIDAVSIIKVEVGQTYRISYHAQKTSGVIGNGGIILIDSNTTNIPNSYHEALQIGFQKNEDLDVEISIIHVATKDYIQVVIGSTGTQSQTIVISDLMVSEGDNNYPYQPYNGAIVHEKQLDDALDNYLPLTGGTINGAQNLKIQVQDSLWQYGIVLMESPSGAAQIFFNQEGVSGQSGVRAYLGVADGTDPRAGTLFFSANRNTQLNGLVYIDSNNYLYELGERVYSPNNPQSIVDRAYGVRPYLEAHNNSSGSWVKFAEITVASYTSWGAMFIITHGYDNQGGCILLWNGRAGSGGGDYGGRLTIISGDDYSNDIVCVSTNNSGSYTYSLYCNVYTSDSYVKFALILDRSGNNASMSFPTEATMQKQPSGIVQTASYYGDNFYSPSNHPPYPVTSVNGMLGDVNIRYYTHIVTLMGSFQGSAESDIDIFGNQTIQIAVQSTSNSVWTSLSSVPDGVYQLYYNGSGRNNYLLYLAGSCMINGNNKIAIASGYASDSGNFNHYFVSMRSNNLSFVSDEILS